MGRTGMGGKGAAVTGPFRRLGLEQTSSVHEEGMTNLRRAVLEFGRQGLTGVCWEPWGS